MHSLSKAVASNGNESFSLLHLSSEFLHSIVLSHGGDSGLLNPCAIQLKETCDIIIHPYPSPSLSVPLTI